MSVSVSVDGGMSVLDLAAARPSDAGWYQCTAQNVAGSTATRARLYVQTPALPEQQGDRRLHLPRPTRVIEPEYVLNVPHLIYVVCWLTSFNFNTRFDIQTKLCILISAKYVLG